MALTEPRSMSCHCINHFVNVESKEFPSAPHSWICHPLVKSFLLLITIFWMARNTTFCDQVYKFGHHVEQSVKYSRNFLTWACQTSWANHPTQPINNMSLSFYMMAKIVYHYLILSLLKNHHLQFILISPCNGSTGGMFILFENV